MIKQTCKFEVMVIVTRNRSFWSECVRTACNSGSALGARPDGIDF